jgi:hypothetical protein
MSKGFGGLVYQITGRNVIIIISFYDATFPTKAEQKSLDRDF